MTPNRSVDTDAQGEGTRGARVLRRYSDYGLMGGLAGGFVVGLVVSGPRFYEWPVTLSTAVVFGAGAIGALIGWGFAGAVGSVAGPVQDVRGDDAGHGGCDGDGDGCA